MIRTLIALGRTLIAFSFFAVYVTSFFIFSVLTLRRWNLRISGPVLRFFGRITLKILGIPLVLVNEWPFGEDEARVVIVNHQSTLDVIWFCAVCPGAHVVGESHFVARRADRARRACGVYRHRCVALVL